MTARTRVAILGATGYTGAELVRLTLAHPKLELTFLGGHGKVGEPIAQALPAFAGLCDLGIEAIDPDRVRERADVAFCALPHGASAPIVAALRERGLITLDLSADFRLRDLAVHREWYGEHQAPALVPSAVYGLCELHADEIRTADLIAVPGCYPTASILALAPLLKAGLIEPDGIIVDAKSGVSGAGRTPSPATHFSETSEGIRAYKTGGQHRHTPEIEQELSLVAGRAIRLTFTPHLVPMIRGILATCYAMPRPNVTAAMCTDAARTLYAGSPSVHVFDPGTNPDTLWTRYTPRAHLSYTLDPRTHRLIAQSTLDNLLKGASSQALQSLELRLGTVFTS